MGKNRMRFRSENNLKFAVVVGAVLLALSFPAEAQQPKKVPRIGFLESGGAERTKSRLAAFEQGLRELGYVQGKNILIEQRYAAGQFEKLPELAAELVRLKLDAILAGGAPAAMRLRRQRQPFPSSWAMPPIPLGPGWSSASPGRAETSQGCRTFSPA